MKNAKVIFSKKHGFATSVEEVTEQSEGQEFVSQYSTDPARFNVVDKEVSEALFDELTEKAGSPDYRVLLTEEATPHTGDISEVPTINVYIKGNKLQKKAV